MADSCSTCRFWRAENAEAVADALAMGECRRRAPSPGPEAVQTVFQRIVESGGIEETSTPGHTTFAATLAIWPTTFHGAWCGEWEAAKRPSFV